MFRIFVFPGLSSRNQKLKIKKGKKQISETLSSVFNFLEVEKRMGIIINRSMARFRLDTKDNPDGIYHGYQDQQQQLYYQPLQQQHQQQYLEQQHLPGATQDFNFQQQQQQQQHPQMILAEQHQV